MEEFNTWNSKKQQLDTQKIHFRFLERDIFFMHIGVNIGFEQNGGKDFLRPAVVYKKFNKHVFLGTPLTSQIKEDKFHHEFEYKTNIRSFAILSQIRLFDIKRAKFRDGQISKKDFYKLQDKLLSLIVTPLEESKGAHKSDL